MGDFLKTVGFSEWSIRHPWGKLKCLNYSTIRQENSYDANSIIDVFGTFQIHVS